MNKIVRVFYFAKLVIFNILRFNFAFKPDAIIEKNFYYKSKKGKMIIGKHFYCRRDCSIINEGSLTIGESLFLNRNVSITCLSEIIIGNHVCIGNNVVVVDHDHDKTHFGHFSCEKIVIGNNVWIGANCVILKGSSIGDNSIIGAGSIVKGDVKSGSVFYQRRIKASNEQSLSSINIEHSDN